MTPGINPSFRQVMAKAWPRVRLGEVCEINPRIERRKSFRADLPVSFVPMAAIDEIHGCIATIQNRPYAEVAKGYTAFQEGDVLLARITPCMENGKAAIAIGLESGIGFGSTEFHVLRPTAGVLSAYIYHFIRRPEFRRIAKANFTGTAGQQRVPTDFVRGVIIPLPPLDEQHRIVDILNHAASIRRLREEAQAKAREIIPALFVEMFGDPITNPKKWQTSPLGQQVAEFRYGTSVKCVDQPVGDALPILRIPNIIGGQVHWDDLKFTALEAKERGRLRLQPNDLLFVRTNGNPDYIGRCAVYSGDREAAYASYLIRARLSPKAVVIPRYVQELVSYPTYRQNLIRNAKTTAGNFNISIDGLERLDLMLPPLPLQQEFAERVAEVEGISTLNDRAATAAEQMAQSLLAQVFGEFADHMP